MALAIMNVGKYTAPSLKPSGDIILKINKTYNSGMRIDKFVKGNGLIVGFSYNTSSIIVSANNGETWKKVAFDRNIGAIGFSEYSNKFYIGQAISILDTSGGTSAYKHRMSIAESSDAENWTWKEINNENYIKVAHTFIDTPNGVVFYYVAGKDLVGTSTGDYATYCKYDVEKETFEYLYSNGMSKKISLAYHNIINDSAILIENTSSTVYCFNPNGNSNSRVTSSFVLRNQKAIKYISPSGSTISMEYSSNLDTTEIITTPYKSGVKTKSVLGYFNVGRVYYCFTIDGIGKAGSLQEAFELPDAEYYPIGDMRDIIGFYHIADNNVLITNADGNVYLCELS